mgnify:FL=1
MLCSKCGSNTRVTKVRHDYEENEVFREHECRVCKGRFHTVEFEVEENESFNKIWKELWNRYRKGGDK